MTSLKIPLTYPSYDVPPKLSNPKVPGFFKIEPRRLSASLEGVKSIALSFGRLCLDIQLVQENVGAFFTNA